MQMKMILIVHKNHSDQDKKVPLKKDHQFRQTKLLKLEINKFMINLLIKLLTILNYPMNFLQEKSIIMKEKENLIFI